MNLKHILFCLILLVTTVPVSSFARGSYCALLLQNSEINKVAQQIEINTTDSLGKDLTEFVNVVMSFDRGFIINKGGRAVLNMSEAKWNQYFSDLDVVGFITKFSGVTLQSKHLLEDGSYQSKPQTPIIKSFSFNDSSENYVNIEFDQSFISFLRKPRQFSLLDFIENSRNEDSFALWSTIEIK